MRMFVLTAGTCLAGYVHVFGLEAQRHLMLRILALEKEHKQRLDSLPVEFSAAFDKRQKAASREPGAEKWVFPHAILDEEAFRTSIGSATDSDG